MAYVMLLNTLIWKMEMYEIFRNIHYLFQISQNDIYLIEIKKIKLISERNLFQPIQTRLDGDNDTTLLFLK